MPYKPGTHADEEVLEGYSLGMLPQPESEAFEEHLLMCPQCQDRLAEAENYVRAMRSGASELRDKPPRFRDSSVGALLRRLARPWPAGTLAVAAIALVAVICLWKTRE